MRKYKTTKANNVFIAILQAIAVCMFVLAIIKFTSINTGCTSTEDIVASPITGEGVITSEPSRKAINYVIGDVGQIVPVQADQTVEPEIQPDNIIEPDTCGEKQLQFENDVSNDIVGC